MNPAQITAFKNAVGGPAGGYVPGDFALIFALIAAAIVLLWGADMIRLLGNEVLQGRTPLRRVAQYKLRVIVLLLLLIYVLHS